MSHYDFRTSIVGILDREDEYIIHVRLREED